jgi:hypothetical protein
MCFYEELINDGVSITELLRRNSGNVGDIGELLALSADKIEDQQKAIEMLERHDKLI